jgi:urea carboxylase
VQQNAASITAFQDKQRKAFAEERERWERSGQLNFSAESEASAGGPSVDDIPEGERAVRAQVPGNVWKILVEPGQRIEKGQALVILESMKMEITLSAPCAGVLTALRCSEGRPVQAGDAVAMLREETAGLTAV